MNNEFLKQGSSKSNSSNCNQKSDFISGKRIGRKELYPDLRTVNLKSRKEKTYFKKYFRD